MKIVREGYIYEEDISIEDSGCAMIVELDDSEDDSPFFFRLHSWDDCPTPEHPEMEMIKGKKVRITLEILEDDDG